MIAFDVDCYIDCLSNGLSPAIPDNSRDLVHLRDMDYSEQMITFVDWLEIPDIMLKDVSEIQVSMEMVRTLNRLV